MVRRQPTTDSRQPTCQGIQARQGFASGSRVWSVVRGPWSAALFLCCLALLLSGCMLMSGGRSSADALPDGGNVSASFVGADGRDEQSVATGAPSAAFNAIVIVQAERGELQLELLNADGSVAFAVKGRPEEAVTRSGNVTTDAEGQLHYRVTATGARNGSYQLLYQRPTQ